MDKTCFIISTIGEKDSTDRRIADEKYDLVFEPILAKLDYDVTRADKVGIPGSISYDLVKRIIESDLVIADISDLNPNVFYELAIRNAIKKPVIVIKDLEQKMPFDIYDKRAISLDMTKARTWTGAKKELERQILESEKDKETASQSILSDFAFPNYVERTTVPDTDIGIHIKEIFAELRQIRNEIHEVKRTNDSSRNYFTESHDVLDLISDVREDDKEILRFITENGGEAFESELRKKFLQPRTTMWRAVKRLERLGFVELRKKDSQTLVKIRSGL